MVVGAHGHPVGGADEQVEAWVVAEEGACGLVSVNRIPAALAGYAVDGFSGVNHEALVERQADAFQAGPVSAQAAHSGRGASADIDEAGGSPADSQQCLHGQQTAAELIRYKRGELSLRVERVRQDRAGVRQRRRQVHLPVSV